MPRPPVSSSTPRIDTSTPISSPSILATDNDILMGGTWIHHHKAKHDKEYLDLVGRVDELGTAAGYHVIRDESDLAGARNAGPRTLRTAWEFRRSVTGPT